MGQSMDDASMVFVISPSVDWYSFDIFLFEILLAM